jgi:hypothetical protein
MKVRLFLSIAVACCVACPWQWLAAEEDIKYPSPDGRFALRITRSKDDEYHPTVELIEKQSGKVMLTLHSASDTELFDPSESVLVWSADSKRVAYGFRDSPPGVRVVRSGRLSVFGTVPVSTKCFCLRTGHPHVSNSRREKKRM